MCGVFAMFLKRPLTEHDIEIGRRATGALRHRGPDAEGEFFDQAAGVYLGHRRLTIIDLSDASNQPMTLGNLVLTYNGEIYNYRDVRDRLKGMGTEFRTSGDTEVLLRAWQQYGHECVDHFDGMFGFALWDGGNGWISVDRYAEKQIYVAATDDGVVIASELPTLIRAVGTAPDMSVEQTAAFMSLGYLPGPDTVYPKVRRMSPGTMLKITEGRIDQELTYWRHPFGNPGRGRIEPIDERGLDRIQEALVQSVERRLESDAPICVYLSSGTDSALVAAMAAKDIGKSLDAVTVSFPRGATHDESQDAKRIAEHLGLSHEVVENEDDPNSVTAEFFLELLGQPSDDLTLASLNQMARTGAERNYKVAVTGMGGDEVFYGYNKHAFFFEHRRILNSPQRLRMMLGKLASPFERFSSRIRTFQKVAAVRDFERYLAVKNFSAIDALRQCPGFMQWAPGLFPGCSEIEQQVPVFEFTSVMTDHRLPSTDVGSMRASLEFRTPFLSRAVQEAVAQLDPRALLAFGQKSVLRRLLRRYLPEALVDLPKRGFVFPADRFAVLQQEPPPKVRGLPQELVSSIWQRRDEAGWRTLAVRTAMLSAFDVWNCGNLRPASSSGTSRLNAPVLAER
ncbi:MAG: asparagine synthase (glutamine-hydrolyzing) [Alphaproteobacteria bacterium]|nr:asparagine synthase (glutamine-hydrolyzing) [Alphaproteobacteria bacterium]